MKGIILYRSLHGCTEQYARWLAEESGFDCIDFRKKKVKDIRNAEVIILGAPVIAGRLAVSRWIISNWSWLKDRKVLLFSTSGAGKDEPVLMAGFESAYSEEIRRHLKYYPMGGRIIMSELKPLFRFMMNMGIRAEKDPKVKEEMARDKDSVNREHLRPLIEALS